MAKLTTYKLGGVIGMLMYLAISSAVFAQQSYKLLVHSVGKDSSYMEELSIQKFFKNPEDCKEYIAKLPDNLQKKGFLAASIDSVIYGNTETTIFLFLGERYNTLQLKINEADRFFMQETGWKLQNNTTITFDKYHESANKVIDYFEDNGYPFAKISLDSVRILNEKIIARLNIKKGFAYKIDSIRIYGPARISKNFIHRYLNIQRGSLYSRSKLEKINQRLLELPYLEQMQPWDINMLNTGSLVNLYLKPKKSNQVNVLAGFLPSNQQTGGKLLLTVDANLQLQNAFGSGESLGILWQQIQPKSPRLNLQYTQPYMFNSPFGVDFSFQLYKKDSAYLNVNGQLGLLYMATPNKTGKIILQTQRTNVLEIDTTIIKNQKKLPDIIDVGSVNVGVEYEINNTDYKINPRKGNELSFSGFTGSKNIRKNTSITRIKDAGFNYNSLYDSIKLKTYQLRARLKAAHYYAIGRQAAFKTGVNAGWFESPNYFRNELFQIGGYRLLRGFDEESIFTNRYIVGTLEYRYLVGLNSNFFVFTDFGYSNNKIIKQSNSYISAGAGLSFETKGGIFNISYAAGKRNDLNFDIKQSKIHLGYISVF